MKKTSEESIDTMRSILRTFCNKKGIVVHDYIPKGYNGRKYWTISLCKKNNSTLLLTDCQISGNENFWQVLKVMIDLIEKL